MKLYNAVIDDVIANVRDAFLDEGVDEQVLQEMKQIWTNKLMASKAVEVEKDTLAPQLPPILANNPKVKQKLRRSTLVIQSLLRINLIIGYHWFLFFMMSYYYFRQILPPKFETN